jgi:isochorismate synthase
MVTAEATAPEVAPLRATTVETEPIDPISLYAAAVEADLEAALWLRPADATAIVGIGRAWAIEPEGPARFREAEVAWRALVAGVDAEPVLIGGLGFTGRTPGLDDPWTPFGAASLVLPTFTYAAASSGPSLTTSSLGDVEPDARALDRRWDGLAARARELAPGHGGIVAQPVFAPLRVATEQPDFGAWRRIVGLYAGAVGRGRLDKVVLARRLDLRSPIDLDVPNALRRLAASAPESTTYAFRRGGRTFLGATPERLAQTDGRAFRTVAVAGSIRRGADADEDARLAAELLASDKDREEQSIVVEAIRAMLGPVAETLEVAAQPRVMTLRFVQHLVTEFAGTLPEGHGLLALAERLHPTPAVGGEPRDIALALIDEHEGFDRGWYAGPIGWLGADGDGELCVALRCGIVDRTRATLFAGCGIVADSDPDTEWEESRMKLRAVISALGMLEDGR